MDSNCVSMTCYDQTFIKKTYMLPAIVVNSCLLNKKNPGKSIYFNLASI